MKRLNILILILMAVWLFGFVALTAHADIYSWTDENGVSHFTNYAPPKHAKLLMKTPEIPYDEEADNQRRETDRLEVARQELEEREAFLLSEQQVPNVGLRKPMQKPKRHSGKRIGFCRKLKPQPKTKITVAQTVTFTGMGIILIIDTVTGPGIIANTFSIIKSIITDTGTIPIPNLITGSVRSFTRGALTPHFAAGAFLTSRERLYFWESMGVSDVSFGFRVQRFRISGSHSLRRAPLGIFGA